MPCLAAVRLRQASAETHPPRHDPVSSPVLPLLPLVLAAKDPSTTRVPRRDCFLSLDSRDAAPMLFMIAAKFHLVTLAPPMIR